MTFSTDTLCTAFEGFRRLASGPLIEVALAVKSALERNAPEQILTFDDATGGVLDLDLRGSGAEILERLAPTHASEGPPAEMRGRGRPKLGVVGREVTLLPRHWDWLAEQPGGASVALRKLIDEARRTGAAAQQRRAAHERAYRFISALAGDLPGYEEAARALFAADAAGFDRETSAWPADVRAYAANLAFAPEAVV